jgi:hypothetical protein
MTTTKKTYLDDSQPLAVGFPWCTVPLLQKSNNNSSQFSFQLALYQ